jgi:WhiB family redox-sensing transcriptional regulator
MGTRKVGAAETTGNVVLTFRIPEWMGRGLCTEVGDTDLFFPDGGVSQDALKICAACEVTGECLAFALEHDERGIWGARSEADRRRMKREAA